MVMRDMVRGVASAWFVCQLIAVVSPLALAFDGFGLDPVLCCDNLEAGQVCPMHHPVGGDRTCRMESACGHHDAALLTIVPIGPPPPSPTTLIASMTYSDAISAFGPLPFARAERPDSPPPRG